MLGAAGWFRLRSLNVAILAMGGVALACQGSPIPVRSAQAEASGPARPKLVVQITVDQLRGDLPMRYRDRLGEGGFRYLLERGVHYANAHYRHANTETAVGHATLVTGADPSAHGMVGNDWRDPVTGAFVYNTEDDRHPSLLDLSSHGVTDGQDRAARSPG